MKIEFTKGHGTGNDFILVLDKAGQVDLSADQVAAMCDRHFGIGADGLIIVKPTAKDSEVAELLEDEPEAIWFMDYRNSDGSRAEMCGNGIRVFARYLLENGLATLTDGSTLPVATRNGIKDLTATVNGFAVDLGLFSIGDDQTLVSTQGLQVSRPGLSVNVGNPHVVVALADLEELQGLELVKAPVLEPLPEDGANVEYVVLDEPLINKGVAGLTMRVHERGSGETMSCWYRHSSCSPCNSTLGWGDSKLLEGEKFLGERLLSGCFQPRTANMFQSVARQYLLTLGLGRINHFDNSVGLCCP